MNQRNTSGNSGASPLRVHSPSNDQTVNRGDLTHSHEPGVDNRTHASSTTDRRAATIETSLTNRTGRIAKRTIDIVLSLPFVLFVLPPLAVVVRLAHWKQSPGSLFFRQVRCGLQNEAFTILKFRTMNEASNDADEEQGDPEQRVFPIGQILRKTKLDEIPQFVNVLLGSMSIVGPRPHHFQDCAAFSDVVEDYALRTITKPGITGLAQYTEYRGDFEWNCTESRVSKDLDYIRKWSPVLDLALIVKTAAVIGRKSVTAIVRRTPFAPAIAIARIRVAAGTAMEPVSNPSHSATDERRAA